MPSMLKNVCFGLLTAGSLLTAVAVSAEDKVLTTAEAEKLMADKGYICLSCHKPDTNLIGPSFQAIATKYQGQEGIVDTLVGEIQKGVSGKWKDAGITAPMPPNSTVTNEDGKALVQWVLSLAPKKEDTGTPPAETPKKADEKPATK